ncbi:hypothetical protein L2E82_41045 [Cichorium intybus]|uniref:Uncharacterized protein n=1 Tax=Cichorium intybus TaxID=13427 RepID=A0ACB9ALQ1_CICIN|nr:hypothetical protein L2E82_41045 [Cichorium intybus]
MGSKGLLFIFIVFCSTFYINQEVQIGDSSQLLVRKSGWKVSDFKYYKGRSLGMNPERATPGGPNPKHNIKPPGVNPERKLRIIYTLKNL